MTVRPVYLPSLEKPYFKVKNIDFDYQPGLAPSQKKKNSENLHRKFNEVFPDKKILEVSTKSDVKAGQDLSPFNLKKHIKSLKKSFPVENIFQASKVFYSGGPFYDLLGCPPLEAKRDSRLSNNGKLVYFELEKERYPIYPDILFYTWLYISALRENPQTAKNILDYDAFTDIEFNPESSNNNQAKACTIFLSLKQLNLLSQTENFEDFKKLYIDEKDEPEMEEQDVFIPSNLPTRPKPVPNKRKRAFAVGQLIEHPNIGVGEVMKKDDKTYTIYFRVSGPKTLAKDFVEKNCSLYLKS